LFLNLYLNLWLVLHGNIDQTLVNLSHGMWNYEIGVLDCHVITTEYTYFVMHWSM